MPQQLRYRQKIVSYIDILAFGDLISSNQPPGFIKSILDHFKSKNSITKKTTHIIFFSDNILRIRQITTSGSIISEIGDLATIQYSLLKLGILLRGAVVIGDIYSWDPTHLGEDKNLVFGPALMQAYLLERHKAKYPTIIVDGSVFGYLEGEAEAGIEVSVRELCSFHSGEVCFIDYMNQLRQEELPEFEARILKDIILDKIHNLVTSCETREEKRTKAEKLYWLSDYINSFCEKNKIVASAPIDSGLLDSVLAGDTQSG